MQVSKTEIEHLADFRRALRNFLRFSERAARQARISPQQHQLLLTIKGMKERHWASVGEIANRLQVSHHAAVALVTRAETLGLVKRTRGKEDRRVVEVSLTDKGEKLIRQLSALHHAELGKLSNMLLKQLRAIRGDAEPRLKNTDESRRPRPVQE